MVFDNISSNFKFRKEVKIRKIRAEKYSVLVDFWGDFNGVAFCVEILLVCKRKSED